MIADFPEPLLPPNVDLRDFAFMPLDVERLQRSRSWRIIAKKKPELGFYMMNLWCASWHEKPAGSLEDDDEILADFAMCPPEKWGKVREKVLHGWVKCRDGRIYHPVVVEKALEAWERKKRLSTRGKCGAEARWHQDIEKPRGHDATSMQEPLQGQTMGNGTGNAKAMLVDGKGQERKGIERESDAERSESPVRAPEPEPAQPAARRYAFEGDVIRLAQEDFDRWQEKFWSIPALVTELAVIDDKARDWSVADQKRWFGKVSGWLRTRHDALVAAGATRGPPDPDADWRPRLEAWLDDRRFWLPEWGPEPDQPGTQVPRRLLAAYGIGQPSRWSETSDRAFAPEAEHA